MFSAVKSLVAANWRRGVGFVVRACSNAAIEYISFSDFSDFRDFWCIAEEERVCEE